jgi:diguanylate cyclase (GGDEF)-like protein
MRGAGSAEESSVKLSFRLVRLEYPAVPFVGIAVLALAATGLRTPGTDWLLIVVALTGSCVFALAGVVAPWSQLPPSALLVLPIAADGLIAVLRQAQGGSTSGYGSLAILPVAWVGLTQGRRAVAVISGATGLLFGLPIVIAGSPLYPASGWRGVVLWTIVALVLGTGANRVVAEQRKRALLARTRARRLDELVEAQTLIATSEAGLDSVLKAAAEAALSLTSADGACVELLDGDEIVVRGCAGVCTDHLGLRLKADTSIAGECFRLGEVLVCTDTEDDPRVDGEACRLVGARSAIVVPLFAGDVANRAPDLEAEVKGVLVVYFARVNGFQNDELQILTLLATMVGGALARAGLMERLTNEAVTDELTGLPNRRAWYQHLARALAIARRSGKPLSILILDLDGFKEVNDREGHAAGDRLLRTLSSCWASELRGSDLLGRIGGDEFGVILEQTDRAAALDVSARLDQAIIGQHGASTGFALWDGDEEATALVARADTDMYGYKKTTRLLAIW